MLHIIVIITHNIELYGINLSMFEHASLILNLGHSVVSNISAMQFHHIIISITCLTSRMTHIFWYIYILGCLSGL